MVVVAQLLRCWTVDQWVVSLNPSASMLPLLGS